MRVLVAAVFGGFVIYACVAAKELFSPVPASPVFRYAYAPPYEPRYAPAAPASYQQPRPLPPAAKMHLPLRKSIFGCEDVPTFFATSQHFFDFLFWKLLIKVGYFILFTENFSDTEFAGLAKQPGDPGAKKDKCISMPFRDIIRKVKKFRRIE